MNDARLSSLNYKNCNFWPLNVQITVSFVRAAGVLAKGRMFDTPDVEDMNPYYVYRVLLEPGDFAESLEFCSWLNSHYRVRRYISFTDKTQLSRDRLHNTIPTCGQMRLLTAP